MDNLDIGLNQISGSIDEMRGRYLTFLSITKSLAYP